MATTLTPSQLQTELDTLAAAPSVDYGVLAKSLRQRLFEAQLKGVPTVTYQLNGVTVTKGLNEVIALLQLCDRLTATDGGQDVVSQGIERQ